MHVQFLRFATLCSAHRSPEFVKSIPNASSKKNASALFEMCDVMFCAPKPRTCQKYPKCIQKKMQVHVLRFATLCSAHRSAELGKSIPIASRKNTSAFVEICGVMFCATKPRTCQKYPKCTQNMCKSMLFYFSTLCSEHNRPELVKSIPNAPRKYARALF